MAQCLLPGKGQQVMQQCLTDPSTPIVLAYGQVHDMHLFVLDPGDAVAHNMPIASRY